jgi:hypothetical protein
MFSKLAGRSTAMDAKNFLRSLPPRWDYGPIGGDRSYQRQQAMDVMRAWERSGYNLGTGFDAATGGGLAFLASQLELPDVKLVEPLAAVTHARDIPIKTGGGYVQELSAWAANYGTTGSNNLGIQENKNLDIPSIQVEVLKGVWPAIIWAATFRVSFVDLQKLIDAKKNGIPAPYSLQDLLTKGLNLAWNKAIDHILYNGITPVSGVGYGLMNNPNLMSVEAPQTGSSSSPLWANKTTTEILNDINTGILTTLEAAQYDISGMADTLLVDYEHWSLLNQPMTTGGFNSLLEYILMNNVARRQGVDFEILPLPDPWIATAGSGGTSEGLFYRKNDDCLYMKIPQPLQKVFTVPSVQGAAYETLYMGCVGVPQILRNQPMLYMYGW